MYKVVISSPVATQSGYGHHAREVIKQFINKKSAEWDIKLLSMPWGHTPMTYPIPVDWANRIVPLPLTSQPDVWEKLENTESNTFRKGEIKKVVDMANKYDKTNPLELKKILKRGDYRRPMILKFGDRYHLVSGNTRLSTAAAMGIIPQVLIAEI